MPPSLSEVDVMDAIDAMDMMDVNKANYQSDDQYPKQDATLPPTHTELFPGASDTFGQGQTYMDLFDEDDHAGKREMNLYYPFASQPEWELASFLLKSGLSMVATDEFLKLQMVSAGVPLLKIWLICVDQKDGPLIPNCQRSP